MEPINQTRKNPWILRWALILGIVIVTNLFIGYAIKVVYHQPEYAMFCEEKQVRIIPETQKECVAVGGQWTEDRFIQKGVPGVDPTTIPVLQQEKAGYCDPDFTCRQGYEDAFKVYERNVFVALAVMGIILLVGSMFLTGSETIAFAMSLSGILSLIIGSVRYWGNMNDYLRVTILGFGLAALLFVAYKKFRDQ